MRLRGFHFQECTQLFILICAQRATSVPKQKPRDFAILQLDTVTDHLEAASSTLKAVVRFGQAYQWTLIKSGDRNESPMQAPVLNYVNQLAKVPNTTVSVRVMWLGWGNVLSSALVVKTQPNSNLKLHFVLSQLNPNLTPMQPLKKIAISWVPRGLDFEPFLTPLKIRNSNFFLYLTPNGSWDS